MRIIEPTACLRPFIKAFIIVESSGDTVNHLLPDTAVTLAFRYKGAVSYLNSGLNGPLLPAFSVSGIRKSPKTVHYSGNSGNILVQFREGGAAAFFPLPIHELFESNLSLDNFFGSPKIRQLEEQISYADSMEEKIKIIERFLIAKIPAQQPDLLIASSIEKINTANGMLRIKALAEDLYISHDAFEKRFRKTVGATPKQFADIVRMKFLISQGKLNRPLTGSALDAGFFDQSHFIREFRKFTGRTPTEFFSLNISL